MQHSIGSRGHSFGSYLTSGGTEEREEFGCTTPFILMWLRSWVAFRLPGSSGLGDGLIGSRFIFIELHDPGSLGLLVR